MGYERNLTDYVPSYYAEFKESAELLRVENDEFATLFERIDDLQAQTRVSTATWGLSEWERILGIKSDESIAIEMRRSAILSKLRGIAPATKATLLSVMEAHTQSKDNVINQRYSEYTVRYIADISQALNYDALMTALRTYTPAHLAVEFGTRSSGRCYTATAYKSGAILTVYPWFASSVDTEVDVNTALLTQTGATLRLNPKLEDDN